MLLLLTICFEPVVDIVRGTLFPVMHKTLIILLDTSSLQINSEAQVRGWL